MSEWSSDVGSSDLLPPLIIALIIAVPRGRLMHDKSNLSYTLCEIVGSPTQWRFSHEIQAISRTLWNRHLRMGNSGRNRSKKRRAGKECVGTLRYRLSQYN